MMDHIPILPILVPLIGGLLLLLPPFAGIERYVNRRVAAAFLCLLQIAISIALMEKVIDAGPIMYAVGNWQAPFGIILYADSLAALLVLLTGFLGLASTLYSFTGTDREGRYFHPVMQFQLMGITGAFLTHDLFNLFVFFEVLLIASYVLLVHGGGKQRTQANVHYVILNLVGSAIFLIALGTLYGTTGTLNIADMSLKISALSEAEQVLAKVGGMMLLVVFGLKAAMLPLHFWLPNTYSAASAPVAALFAIMTKVGIYSIFRVFTVIFGDEAGALSNMILPWIWPLAILTVIVGTIGVLASPNLRNIAANTVLISVGTLLMAFSIRSPEASAAAFYYALHSTLISAVLFMLADMIGQQRGKAFDRFVVAKKVTQPTLLGALFFVAAMVVVGLPPFSGFIGKVVVLQSAASGLDKALVWSTVLISTLLTIIALARAGTTLFWRHAGESTNSENESASFWQVVGVALLLVASPVMAIFAGPITEYTATAATQLHDVRLPVSVLQLQGGPQ